MRITKQFFRPFSVAVLALAVAGGAVPAQTEIPEYEIVEIGTFGSPGSETYSSAYGLNERGDVVGVAEDDDYVNHAFLFRNGELIDVGAFNPMYPAGSGKAVNADDQVAGSSKGWSPYPKFPTWVDRPFLAAAGGVPFDPASGIGIEGEAFDINDRGQLALTVAGVSEFRVLSRAYLWDPETGLREIEFPSQPEGDDAGSAAWGINQPGQVAGAFIGEDFAQHAYVWDPETNEVVDLHNPLAAGSSAFALNDLGDAAGWFLDVFGNRYAVVWADDGRIVSIPALLRPELTSGATEDVNNLGDVVGWDSTQEDEDPLAWVAFDAVYGELPNGYPESIALVDLLNEADRAEWELWYAYGINDARQIVGVGMHDGLFRGFLMTPPCPDTGPPEVEILDPLRDLFNVVPSTVPFDAIFRSSDEDGGAIQHEVMLIDDCPAFDGDTYGNQDGLLSDEELHVNAGELCRVFAECGFDTLRNPEIRVQVTDCGGSVGSDAATLPGDMEPVRCHTLSPVTPMGGWLETRGPGDTSKTRAPALRSERRHITRETSASPSRRE